MKAKEKCCLRCRRPLGAHYYFFGDACQYFCGLDCFQKFRMGK